jgi:hypothetical protein
MNARGSRSRSTARAVALEVPRVDRLGRPSEGVVGRERGHPLVLGAAQAKHLERLAAAGVGLGRQVVEPGGLPDRRWSAPAAGQLRRSRLPPLRRKVNIGSRAQCRTGCFVTVVHTMMNR